MFQGNDYEREIIVGDLYDVDDLLFVWHFGIHRYSVDLFKDMKVMPYNFKPSQQYEGKPWISHKVYSKAAPALHYFVTNLSGPLFTCAGVNSPGSRKHC